MRLKQVFNNLLSNSFKFTKTGHIEIGYTNEIIKQVPYFQFYVSDSGIGIPPKDLRNIFNRFRKLDHDGKNLYRGTGLGLAITKKILKYVVVKYGLNLSKIKGQHSILPFLTTIIKKLLCKFSENILHTLFFHVHCYNSTFSFHCKIK